MRVHIRAESFVEVCRGETKRRLRASSRRTVTKRHQECVETLRTEFGRDEIGHSVTPTAVIIAKLRDRWYCTR